MENKDIEVEISTDNRTVWINSILGYCLARFAPMAGEIFIVNPAGIGSTKTVYTNPNWLKWKEKVKEIYSLDIKDNFKPHWAK